MTKLFTLFSSSAGNSTCLCSSGGAILIDAGGSCKKIITALESHGVEPANVGGIVLTHEHSDHISGLRVFLNRFPVPVYATEGTLLFLEREGLIPAHIELIPLSKENVINDISFTYFNTQHDAADSCGYVFTMPDGANVGFATDLGAFTGEVYNNLKDCKMVVLESNYDPAMLEVSGYPYPLIRRIKSEHGHLSNDDCACAAVKLIENGVCRLLLAHTSRQNNLEELAYQTTFASISAAAVSPSDYLLEVAPKFTPSPVLNI